MVYLDYSAHTPPDREVMAAFMNTELDNPGNANSTHAYGMQAMELVKSAQNHIRDLMKAHRSRLPRLSGNSNIFQPSCYKADSYLPAFSFFGRVLAEFFLKPFLDLL